MTTTLPVRQAALAGWLCDTEDALIGNETRSGDVEGIVSSSADVRYEMPGELTMSSCVGRIREETSRYDVEEGWSTMVEESEGEKLDSVE